MKQIQSNDVMIGFYQVGQIIPEGIVVKIDRLNNIVYYEKNREVANLECTAPGLHPFFKGTDKK